MKRSRQQIGFTLVELLIVAVLITVFAAIIVPHMSNSDDEAKAATAYQVVRAVARQIDRHRDGSEWPARVEAEWFRGGKLPVNPLHPDHARTIQSDNDRNARKWHPINKTTATHPFWYNPANGAIRVRVPAQATEAETLALYNEANGTSARDLGDTSK